MAAPIGNRFWELRSKHGRDTLFETPDLMWEAACEYFEWCEANTIPEVDFVGKDATQVSRPKMRPFTMEGLCSYLDCNTQYFNQFEKRIADKEYKGSEDFSWIVSRIKETVFNQQFTGAASGFLNPNIIARRNGLRENTSITGKDGEQFPSLPPVIQVYNTAPPLSDSEDQIS